MSRRSSTRAQAQDIYARISAQEPAPSAVPTDLPARAHALYEGAAVPVRDIARLAGVSERTMYKYAPGSRAMAPSRAAAVARKRGPAHGDRGRRLGDGGDAAYDAAR